MYRKWGSVLQGSGFRVQGSGFLEGMRDERNHIVPLSPSHLQEQAGVVRWGQIQIQNLEASWLECDSLPLPIGQDQPSGSVQSKTDGMDYP